MSEDRQFMGWMTETTTCMQMHCSEYMHHKLSEVIECLLDKPMFAQAGVQRVQLTPKFAKKSTAVSEKSEKLAEEGPKNKASVGSQASAGSIITEQGIQITFGASGPAFSRGPI